MVFVILLVWILAWTPYVILHCWIMFFETQTLSAEMAIAPSLCCKLSAAVNSLLYGVRWEHNQSIFSISDAVDCRCYKVDNPLGMVRFS